jgi:DNA-directed RNA polymerase specialized sigma24 family protein
MTSRKTTPQDLTNGSALSRRIDGAAGNVSRQYGADFDDVHSEIVLGILETYAEDPSFLEDNTDAYVVTCGVWSARDHLRRECNLYYNRTVDGDAPARDGDGDALLDLVPAEGDWSEVEFGLAVETALEELDAEDARIARMYAGGWNAQEIADEVGIGRRTVYYRLNHGIRDALEAQVYA